MRRLNHLLLIVFLFITGCSSSSPPQSRALNTHIQTTLYEQYNTWQGVPYYLGGLSKKGIDCSGFTYLTFKQRFNTLIPRTTDLQSKQGHSVSINTLKAGDLIFFKTGWFNKHVGIYLSNGKFLHASTSKGVTISKLENSYWKKHYWKAKRVLE